MGETAMAMFRPRFWSYLPPAHVPLVVEAKLSQRVVVWECLNYSHYSFSRHIVGFYIEAGDGRVLLQHLGDGQSHWVIGSGVGETKDANVCVEPQRLSESDERFLQNGKVVVRCF